MGIGSGGSVAFAYPFLHGGIRGCVWGGVQVLLAVPWLHNLLGCRAFAIVWQRAEDGSPEFDDGDAGAELAAGEAKV